MMDGEDVPAEQSYHEPNGVIPRESTDFFAIEDELVGAAMRFIEQSTRGPINVSDVSQCHRRDPSHFGAPL